MSDLISRQKAIEALKEYEVVESDNFTRTDPVSMMAVATIANCIEAIVELPSAEPERKKGEWIEISWSEPEPNVCCTSYSIQSAKCSICGKYHTTPYLHSLVYFPYCPNCGAHMRGDK